MLQQFNVWLNYKKYLEKNLDFGRNLDQKANFPQFAYTLLWCQQVYKLIYEDIQNNFKNINKQMCLGHYKYCWWITTLT